MKDIESTLRRLDEEIVGHHQQIAAHQVAIMRLQDTRKLLLGLAEDDMHAAEQAKLERGNVINGAHASPVLIVRRTGAEDVDEAAKKREQRKKYREAYNATHKRDYDRERELRKQRKLAAKAVQVDVVRSDEDASESLRRKTGRAPRTPKVSASGYFRPKVLETLQGLDEHTGGMTRQQIGDYLGMPRGDKPRKALTNAISHLHATKQIRRDEDGRYMLVTRP